MVLNSCLNSKAIIERRYATLAEEEGKRERDPGRKAELEKIAEI